MLLSAQTRSLTRNRINPCILSREVKEYFEQVSSQWDTMRQGFYGEEVREAVLMAARILPDQTVLDVGAGTGFLTEAASKKARKVIALDFSESMIAEARTKLAGRNVECRIGSAEQIPLPDASGRRGHRQHGPTSLSEP